MNRIDIPLKLKILSSNEEVISELITFIQGNNFNKVALITTRTPNHLITNEIETSLFDRLEKIKTFQVIDASTSYVNQLSVSDFDVAIGVGGGKVIDTAKYAAHLNHIPCISIPTVISNDGICSPVAVLRGKNNKYQSLGATIPVALFVPLHLVEVTPEENITSGVGDLLSNLSAIEDWKLASKENSEYIDDYAVMVSRQAALNIFSEIKNYILQGKNKTLFLKNNQENIIESLALSGIAMEIAGTSRPASGAEHLISHAIDELYGGLKLHGIQVAFGTYITTFLRSELGYLSKHDFEELKAILRFMGLPITLSTIGLTKEQLIEVITHAPKTRADRFTILNKISTDKNYTRQLLDKLFGAKTTVLI